jgi:hypothetical protein
MRPGDVHYATEKTVDGIVTTVKVATMCERPICGMNSILKVNGDCEACTEGQKAVAGGYYCVDEHADGHDAVQAHADGHRLLEGQVEEEKVDVFMG